MKTKNNGQWLTSYKLQGGAKGRVYYAGAVVISRNRKEAAAKLASQLETVLSDIRRSTRDSSGR